MTTETSMKCEIKKWLVGAYAVVMDAWSFTSR